MTTKEDLQEQTDNILMALEDIMSDVSTLYDRIEEME